MRKKLMRWLAAEMALCLTLGAAPAASAAQLPQDAPGFEKIMPYALYILDSSCNSVILRIFFARYIKVRFCLGGQCNEEKTS